MDQPIGDTHSLGRARQGDALSMAIYRVVVFAPCAPRSRAPDGVGRGLPRSQVPGLVHQGQLGP